MSVELNGVSTDWNRVSALGCVLEAAWELWGVSSGALLSKSREQPLAWRRQIVMLALKEQFRLTNREVSILFKGHHTTVIYAVRCVRDSVEVDRARREDVRRFMEALVAVRRDEEMRKELVAV